MRHVDFDDKLHETYATGRRLSPDVLDMWMRIVSELLEDHPVQRVLDLGAGTGRFSEPLASALRAEVVALDPSRRMLAGLVAGASRVVACAEAIPFPARSFDVVFASMIMHHLDDPARAMSEVARVLRPGGSFLVRTCFPETLAAPYHRFFPALLDIERRMLPTETAFTGWLADAGLTLRTRRRVRQRMDDSQRAYADRIRQRAMSPLRLISDEEFEAGMAELDAVAAAEGQPVPVHEDIELLCIGLEVGAGRDAERDAGGDPPDPPSRPWR